MEKGGEKIGASKELCIFAPTTFFPDNMKKELR